MAKRNVKYIITEEFKTNKPNLTEKELKEIFNRKLFRYIMKTETNLFNIDETEKKN